MKPNPLPADDPATRHAHRLIRALLDGTPLPVSSHGPDLGPWDETVQALLTACAQGGQAGVQAAFAALARQEPALVALLASDEHAGLRTAWTLAELYATDFPPPRFVVPDLLPAGLTILAGRPKLGKSWLALQLAAAVGAGQAVLDQPAERGGVLYLALEDTPGRLKERRADAADSGHAAITFHTAWAPLAQQRLVDLLLAAGQGYRLARTI